MRHFATMIATAFVASALIAGSPALASTDLKAPFVPVQPVLKKQTTLTCAETPPKPVISLDVTSIYNQNDPSRSHIDEDQFDEYSAGMKPIRDFLSEVTKNASDYAATDGRRVDDGMCALAWIDAWAKGGALSQLKTRQSSLSSTRIVGGLAIAFLVVRPLAEALHYDTGPIKAWFAARADNFKAVYDDSGNLNSNSSNHRYWGGFAVGASGVATGDDADLKWAVNSFRIGVCQVTPEGALPLELKRKTRARNYHLHAIGPLIMIAELAAANGIDAYSLCGGAIHRLVKFALTSVTHPARIEQLAGAKMEALPMKDGATRGDRFAWTEPYFKRFGGSAADYGFTLDPPLYSSNLGGRWTAYADTKAN